MQNTADQATRPTRRHPRSAPAAHWPELLLLGLAAVVVLSAKIRATGSDAYGTMLVAKAIIEQQTIRLDAYPEVRQALDAGQYQFIQHGRHLYYYFPIGTPLFSLPFVALASLAGYQVTAESAGLQIIAATVTSVLTLFFMLRIAALLLPAPLHLVVASGFWFGSSLVSTFAMALWSGNVAVLFITIAIYALIRIALLQSHQLWPLASASLFFAYLCRPTVSLVIPMAILFLWSYDWRMAVKASLLIVVMAALFVSFSLHEYGQLVPPYYAPSRLEGTRPAAYLQAIYGNILSPARGLLVYSPFLIIAPISWLFLPDQHAWPLKRSWLLIAVVWPVLHLMAISRFPAWWGGWCFGARLMADVLPGLYLGVIYVVRTRFSVPPLPPASGQRLAAAALAVSFAFAIYVNSYQGIHNEMTAAWNTEPNVDRNPHYLFDWSYPQFLANPDGHAKRLRMIQAGTP